jgi:carboxyl-terminal processing protease
MGRSTKTDLSASGGAGSRPAPPERLFPAKFRRSPRAVAGALLFVVAASGPSAAGTTIESGLRLVDQNYLFVDELDAPRLLGEALSFVEKSVPEVRAEETADGGFLMEAGPCTLRMELPPGAGITDLAGPLADAATVLERCIAELPEALPSPESLVLMGVLSGLDPYSTVFDRKRRTEHTIQFRGKLAGIGARIGIRDGDLTLVTVYKDSPAYKSGLRDDDIVRRVDGVSTINMPVSDAVERIRGQVGTEVALTIDREGNSEQQTVKVTRGLVTIPSVEAQRLDNGVIYASISHFSQTTPSDFEHRVGDLLSEGWAPGVIIDLRANSGGSMLGSSSIADLFLEEGLLITTAGRYGAAVAGLTGEIRATPETPFVELPVAILTSPRTASGSELMSASLRNNDRAILIGEHTFGKGTVQKTYSLGADASLKLTVGHFLPKGISIPGGGMTPDVEFQTYLFNEFGAALPRPYTEEDDLPFWLQEPSWLEVEREFRPAIIKTARTVEIPDEEEESREPEKTDPGDEEIVQFAAEILARRGSRSARAMKAAAASLIAEKAAVKDRELSAFLEARNIDWRPAPDKADAAVSTKGAAPHGRPSGAIEVTFTAAGGHLVSGETGRLKATVKNVGSEPLYRVAGATSSEVAFLDRRGLLFGYLAPGQSKSADFAVEPAKNLHTARLEADLVVSDQFGEIETVGPFRIALAEIDQPRIAHRIRVERSAENPGILDIEIAFQNRGGAPAEELRAFLKNPESNTAELVEGTVTVENLEAGAEALAKLRVRMLESTEEAPVVELLISEAKFRVFIESELTLAPTDGYGAWREAPRISLQRIRNGKDADGREAWEILAVIEDEDGLRSTWTSVDGEKLEFVDSRTADAKLLEIPLPWNPEDPAHRVIVVATDRDGLTTRYVTDL